MRAESKQRHHHHQAALRIRPVLLHPRAAADATLQSWKEIASELNRGVRTVQRWERDLKMPVRRIGNGRRAPVFALKSELYDWLRNNPGVDACGKEGSSHEAPLDLKIKIKPNAKLMQALENLFPAEPAAHGEGRCSDCDSRMQLLKGQLWIYGTSRKRSLSVALCPVCDADSLQTIGRHQWIQ